MSRRDPYIRTDPLPGELAPIRVGSVYRFTPESVDEYLAQRADHSYARWERRESRMKGD